MNNSNLLGMPDLIKKLGEIVSYIANIEQGILTLSTNVTKQELILGMLFEILVDKEIISKEELTKLGKEKVVKPMKEHIEDMEQKLRKQAEEVQKVAEATDEDIKENVVLASERFQRGKGNESPDNSM